MDRLADGRGTAEGGLDFHRVIDGLDGLLVIDMQIAYAAA